MSAVAVPEVKYQALKTFTVQEMIDPETPMLVDDEVVMTTYNLGDILPEGTTLQWGQPSLRRMINNEQITPVGQWDSSGRGPRKAPAPHPEDE